MMFCHKNKAFGPCSMTLEPLLTLQFQFRPNNHDFFNVRKRQRQKQHLLRLHDLRMCPGMKFHTLLQQWILAMGMGWEWTQGKIQTPT